MYGGLRLQFPANRVLMNGTNKYHNRLCGPIPRVLSTQLKFIKSSPIVVLWVRDAAENLTWWCNCKVTQPVLQLQLCYRAGFNIKCECIATKLIKMECFHWDRDRSHFPFWDQTKTAISVPPWIAQTAIHWSKPTSWNSKSFT